jgi:hypothetical protein
MPLYMFLHNLLNVLVQIANKMGLPEERKHVVTVDKVCVSNWIYRTLQHRICNYILQITVTHTHTRVLCHGCHHSSDDDFQQQAFRCLNYCNLDWLTQSLDLSYLKHLDTDRTDPAPHCFSLLLLYKLSCSQSRYLVMAVIYEYFCHGSCPALNVCVTIFYFGLYQTAVTLVCIEFSITCLMTLTVRNIIFGDVKHFL